MLFYHAWAPHLLSDRQFDMQGWQCGSWSKGWNDRIGSEQVSQGHGEEIQVVWMQLHAIPYLAHAARLTLQNN